MKFCPIEVNSFVLLVSGTTFSAFCFIKEISSAQNVLTLIGIKFLIAIPKVSHLREIMRFKNIIIQVKFY